MNPTIPAPDLGAMDAARALQAALLKPHGALGQLETLSIRLTGMTGRLDWMPAPCAVLLFAADHGVTAHGVSTVPAAITAYMVGQFMEGNAAVNVLARQMGAALTVVDVGVNADLTLTDTDAARFIAHKVAYGTVDFTMTRAMTSSQAAAALNAGAQTAADAIARGVAVLVIGEMGIGNTTSASAIIAAITRAPAARVTGRGTGVDDETLARKIALVETALRLHYPAHLETLSKVGGFEIGAMAGAMLHAASRRIPVILDGLICTAAALIAHQLVPNVTDYLIAGHVGAEPGHTLALDYLGLAPLLSLGLRLGEGTGALLALPLLEAAMRTLNEMGTLNVG